jgi:HEAT repeat protein
MKDRVDELIEAFHNAGAVGQESPAKIDALSKLRRIDDARITRFLIGVAEDPAEYDLARIEALKALALGEVDPDDREAVVRMIQQLLDHDEDDEVRSYAARALAGFAEVPGALDLATSRVLDPDEDVDVRHNAFFAIERSEPTVKAISAMERCLADDEFCDGAARVLESWRQSRR